MSRVTFLQAVKRLDERKIKHSGVKDRGFMDSIYFKDPLGLLIELASYRFEPPPDSPMRTCSSGAPDPRRARRLQHRRNASRRRHRELTTRRRETLRRPLAEEPY